MKKIKLLYGLLTLVNVLSILMISTQLILLVIPDLYHSKVYDNFVLGKYNHLVLSTLLSLIVYGSFIIQQGINAIIKNGFFNTKSEIKFRKAGMLLILFTFLRVLYILVINSEFALSELINNLVLALLVSIVGIGLLIFSDFIKDGEILQQENDLTI